MRLFIAIDFEELRDYFKELQQQLPDVPQAKATLPKQFHLTLKFLGDVPDNKLPEIKERLSKVSFTPFTLKLGSIGVFPDEHFIRVVWVGLEDHKAVEELQQGIDDIFEQMFKREKRFHPHLTLARIKFLPQESKQAYVEALKKITVEPKEAKIGSFKLIKSTLTPEGPEYEVLEEYK